MQASGLGSNALNFAARREMKILPPFQHFGESPISEEFMEINDVDYNARHLMTQLQVTLFVLSQPNGVMSSAVSLPKHTSTGQA